MVIKRVVWGYANSWIVRYVTNSGRLVGESQWFSTEQQAMEHATC